jgi:hypothetical protein
VRPTGSAGSSRLIAEARGDRDDAEVERYPDHLVRFVLWAGASVLYGVREHPDEDLGPITVGSWPD